MAEYIEREILFEEIRKEFRPYWQIPCDYEDKVTQKMVTKMRGLIDKLPPADVVEVVRCKYCIHRDKAGLCQAEGQKLTIVKDNHFCGKGERKDGK